MTLTPTDETQVRRPLRLWPGVTLVVLQWLAWLAMPRLLPDFAQFALMAGLLGGTLLIFWWLFWSRAPWSERLGALVLMAAGVALTYQLAHPSIAAPGGMGFFVVLGFTVPVLSLVLVVWAATTSRLDNTRRWAALVAGVMVGCGAWTLVRTGGVTGVFQHEIAWRWSPTPEDQLLATESGAGSQPAAARATLPPATAEPSAPAPGALEVAAATATTGETAPGEPSSATIGTEPEAPVAPNLSAPAAVAMTNRADTPALTTTPSAATVDPRPAAWPGFRGLRRDGVVHGLRLATNWTATPPVELWRRPVGPGWSSFAVAGDVIYTQEQRGEEELVSCYRLSNGEPVWRHADQARFWEPAAGAGPRATPTLHAGRVVTLGATGILNMLDARDGSLVWSRNPAVEHEVKVPDWGFAGSPVVVGDLVITAVSGRLAAYDFSTGTPRWTVPSDGGGYSSPHLVTLHGVEQVLLQRGKGVVSVSPADGTVLWSHEWPSVSIVQPAVLPDGDLLLTDRDNGIRRIRLTAGAAWTAEERWTAISLKPFFNDFVAHQGHAYGFDGFIMASVNVDDGKRAWKGGRYGNGQLILLADQDLLLVLGEKGDLALVSATPDGFAEVARFPDKVLTGKTWNHPVLVGDTLLVRNDREMAAFRLPREGS